MLTQEEIKTRLTTINAQVELLIVDDEKLDDVETLLTESETLQAELTALEERERRRETLTARTEQLQRFRESAPQPVARNGNHVVQVGEPQWMTDPARGYASPRMFLYDVMRAETLGVETPQLLSLKVQAAVGSDEQSGINDPYGGYLIPSAFSPTMLMVGFEGDPTVGRTTAVPMSAPLVQIPARTDKDHTTSVTGGLIVYRRAQADTVNATRLQTELIPLRANPLMGISYATEELISDSPISFVALIEAGFREEYNSRLFEEKVTGTGAGEYLGVLNSPALIEVTREAADQISYNDVVNIRSRMWGYQTAIWLAAHDTMPQLMTMQLAPSSTVVWQPSIREDRPDLLLGRPIFFTEYVPRLGQRGDLLCVRWSEYLEGSIAAIDQQQSIHVRFIYNERAFRLTARNDGQPWWRSALTPKNGGPTLSPYVTLAA